MGYLRVSQNIQVEILLFPKALVLNIPLTKISEGSEDENSLEPSHRARLNLTLKPLTNKIAEKETVFSFLVHSHFRSKITLKTYSKHGVTLIKILSS